MIGANVATASKTTPVKATPAAGDKTPDKTTGEGLDPSKVDAAAQKILDDTKKVDTKTDEGDEFAEATVIKVDAPAKSVVPLDRIPESIRGHVALAVQEGPQVILIDKWPADKRKKYVRLAKQVGPHLPGGRKVKVVPTKHDGKDAFGLSVYIPRPRTPKAVNPVPPVHGTTPASKSE